MFVLKFSKLDKISIWRFPSPKLLISKCEFKENTNPKRMAIFVSLYAHLVIKGFWRERGRFSFCFSLADSADNKASYFFQIFSSVTVVTISTIRPIQFTHNLEKIYAHRKKLSHDHEIRRGHSIYLIMICKLLRIQQKKHFID